MTALSPGPARISTRNSALTITTSASPTGGRQQQHASAATRRTSLAAAALSPLTWAPCLARAADPGPPSSSALTIEVLEDVPGSGTAAARQGDLLLLHYVGTLPGGGVFDSTRGGAAYRDGGNGVLRPAIITLGGAPVPGICAGLQQGLAGMRVGGRRTFHVPPGLGFGEATVLAPYGVVPGGSDLTYEVELLRLSRRGPDALMAGVVQCGAGFANERTAGCADIAPAKFV